MFFSMSSPIEAYYDKNTVIPEEVIKLVPPEDVYKRQWCGFAGHFLVRSSRKFYDCLGFAMNVQINICTFIVP